MSFSPLKANARSFVLGQRGFAAITAVEGLKLSQAGEARLQRNQNLPPEQRRAETIRSFVEAGKGG